MDWAKTTAWGSGGYYARLFLNVKGREPEGIIDPADYEKVRDELAERIAAVTDPDGKCLGSVAYKPDQIYRTVNNIAPDLIVYFGNLRWRCCVSAFCGTPAGSGPAPADRRPIRLPRADGARFRSVD